MKSIEEIKNILSNAHGTNQYHMFSPFREYPVLTDGVKALAEAADCFWLVNIIGSYQLDERLDPYFQVWKLEVNQETKEWVITGCNDTKLIITQTGDYTDFPLNGITLWVSHGVILLPSEW